MTQFIVPVHEYDSSRPGAPLHPSHVDFIFNDRQLVIAMVRAILTSNPGKPAKKLIAAVTRPTLRFMLEWGRAPRLQLSGLFSEDIRDFSFTSRVGELAQGVSCAYWKWARGYAWICDFGPWASGLRPPLPAGKSPDFVMLNARTGDLAVMEAKGTGSSCHKTPMLKALTQCNAALAHKAFNRGYGSVLTLERDALFAAQGSLHIRDPETVPRPDERTAYEVFKRSYVSWFELIGDYDMAAWCRGDENAQKSFGQRPDISDPADVRSLVVNEVIPSLGFDLRRTRFTIEPAVREALDSFDVFRAKNWLSSIAKDAGQDGNVMRFPDGTVIEEQ